MESTALNKLKEDIIKEKSLLVVGDYSVIKGDIFDQVLKMINTWAEYEKYEIIKAWNHGFDWGRMEQSLAEQGMESTLIDAKHYYNETYNK